MYRKQFIILIQVILFLLFANLFSVFAETIILESGKQIKGKIVEKTDSYIKIKVKDVPFPLIYYLDEIKQIDEPSVSSEDTTSNSSLDRSEMLKEYLTKIRQYYLSKKYEKAVLLLQKAIKLDPDNPDYYVDLGALYCYLEKFENAISSLQEALKLDPEDDDAYVELGIVYSIVGSSGKSKENFLKAIKYYKEDDESDISDFFLLDFLLKKIDKYDYE